MTNDVDTQANLKCLADAAAVLVANRTTVNASTDVTAYRVRNAMRRPGAMYRHLVAMLFWGRKEYTPILRPYMERELAVYGGAIDEIWLCMTTPMESERAAGRAWAAEVPQVRAFDVPAANRSVATANQSDTVGAAINYCYEGLLPRAASANGWSLKKTLIVKVNRAGGVQCESGVDCGTVEGGGAVMAMPWNSLRLP